MASISVGNDRVALVDDEDLERVSAYSWYAYQYGDGLWYARCAESLGGMYLHRFVMGDPPGMEVDHRNGNGLDNRRSNLRIASHQQNLYNQRLSKANKSGYRGVCWFKGGKRQKRWIAQLKVNGKTTWRGYFLTAEEAAREWDNKARVAYGPFARLNFPEDSSEVGIGA